MNMYDDEVGKIKIDMRILWGICRWKADIIEDSYTNTHHYEIRFIMWTVHTRDNGDGNPPMLRLHAFLCLPL